MESPLLDEKVESADAGSPAPDPASIAVAEGGSAVAAPSSAPSGRESVPRHLEDLFLTMHYRKLQRDLNGPQKKKTKFHFIALGVLLILVYGVSATSYVHPMDAEGGQAFQITLNLNQIILIGVWIFVAILITTIFGASKFIIVLYWMLVYWPLLTLILSGMIHREELSYWIGIFFFVAEIGTLLGFILVYHVYPHFVTSKWFKQYYGAKRFWRMKLLNDGVTMEYDGMWGRFGRKYQCHYVGETDGGGLPHGWGVWTDNQYNGEILTGMWEGGRPVAPFSSRQYGTGDTFSSVRLAYFMATDDTFEANKLVPTNDGPPRCGVAGVECSVAGDFMSHLPDASLLGDFQVEGENGITIGNVCKRLDCGSSSEEQATTSLRISANDPRGVQIGGHLFELTGLPFTKRVNQVVINIKRSDAEDEDEYEDLEDGAKEEPLDSIQASTTRRKLSLEVEKWHRVQTKDALIFLPGFNSWLKHSCETLGQMMAMTTLGKSVYPILFAWPGAQVLTYRQASLISASEKNKEYFLQMLRSLKAEGFLNIHIVTHSLGVQTMMNCFEDNEDGSPSPVSKCFGPAPKDTDLSSSLADLGKLVCRSVTMLNPDYPVDAFREHGFRSLRRVCPLITVVGDRTDQALFWSSLINGLVNRFGYSQPSALDSEARRAQTGFRLQAPIGRRIDALHAAAGEGKERDDYWLDLDAIDTSGLDTNVNDLRHSAYTVNSILLRDIEEIVTTGKRARDRTTLLRARGNVFEYCHAPSFVKQ